MFTLFCPFPSAQFENSIPRSILLLACHIYFHCMISGNGYLMFELTTEMLAQFFPFSSAQFEISILRSRSQMSFLACHIIFVLHGIWKLGVEQNFVLWQELPEFSFFSFLFAMVQFARSNLWIKQTLSAINFDTFHV